MDELSFRSQMGFPCQISEFLGGKTVQRWLKRFVPGCVIPRKEFTHPRTNFFWPSLYTTRLDVRSDGRRGPQVCKVAVVPQDEFGEDDVLDDGVEQEVRQSDEAPEDGAEEEA